MLETWIIVNIIACFLQNIRSLFQKKLQKELSNTGSTYTRFGYGFPFVIIYFYLLSYMFDFEIPKLNFEFIFYCIIGGVSQIIATYLLLKTFLLLNFAVANAYSKTEPIQAAFFGIIILSEQITSIGFIAIVIAVLGVLLIPISRDISLSNFREKMLNFSTIIGVLSGTLFGIAGVCFRGASLSLVHESSLMVSATTLLIAMTLQFVIFTLYLVYKEPQQIILSFKNYKYSMIVGASGATASMCWFYCMAVQNVAYVRALGQIELLFSFIVSIFYLKEKVRLNEIIGICLMLFGIILIVLYT